MSVLNLVINSLAALGAIGAAIVAVVIAGQASRSRDRERRDAAEAQARLVQVEVKQAQGLPDFNVEIHNYGDRAIIAAAVTHALFFGHPEYTWRHSDINHDREKIVRPEREAAGGKVRIQFLDGAGKSVRRKLASPNFMNQSSGQSSRPKRSSRSWTPTARSGGRERRCRRSGSIRDQRLSTQAGL
jgi:hypothetical protein